MKKETLVIACVSLLAVAIFGGQLVKQKSVEKQVQMKIDQENKLLSQDNQKEAFNRSMVNTCIAEADEAYWDFMKLNGKENEDGSIYALDRFWSAAKANKKDAVDLCYKKYN